MPEGCVNDVATNTRFVVKNTFLCQEDQQRPRRCSSVPASLRLALYGKQLATKACAGPASESYSDASTRWDASTEEGSTQGDPERTELSVELDHSVFACASADSACSADRWRAHAAPWTTGLVLAQMLADPTALAREIQAEAVQLWSAWTQRRTRLNSGARAWAPSEAAAPAAVARRDFREEVQALVLAAKSALEAGPSGAEAEVTEGTPGWSILAQLPSRHRQHRDQLLLAAKESLLRSAEQLTSTYVLGHQRQPFKVTPLGFTASLMCIEDPSGSCWTFVEQGCCRFGSQCQWHHPACKMVVNVMVTLASQ